MTSSLTTIHKNFKKVLMGQVSIRRLAIWFTRGRLRWKKGREYKRRRIPLQMGSSEKREKNHFVTKNLNIWIGLRVIYIYIYIYIRTYHLWTWPTNVFLFNLFVLIISTPTNLLWLHLTHWMFSNKPIL